MTKDPKGRALFDPNRQGSLLSLTRCYDFHLWFSRHLQRFPRCHRHILGERAANTLSDLLDTRRVSGS